ncbi:MarR family winged helix-turn-helix transcriptional regulator [Glutamicibacter sp. MNS18]|uniref:MarR family winged helix-turn-helix transcriptional regulator n=1 Tax=Glutamicibacter sp. MNS18 TaxID=2989817 RepID=UPI002235BF64|nr:MarR family winged helix-turn-helix transcriptional regulator [Glutamicibacter sp. MNS18]MCW4464296.1 MarR family winged helix-turn-helix transcriptional regulator [Glutamicibacter sp. MNS18]
MTTPGGYEALVYEQMLLTRYALQNTAPQTREVVLDRSATVLLARLEASGPMSVGQLAESFGLDVSTVHRQVAAAIKAGLIERVQDAKAGVARTHRPTPEGSRRLRDEFGERARSLELITSDWSDGEISEFVRLLTKFNHDVERIRGQQWPRRNR